MSARTRKLRSMDENEASRRSSEPSKKKLKEELPSDDNGLLDDLAKKKAPQSPQSPKKDSKAKKPNAKKKEPIILDPDIVGPQPPYETYLEHDVGHFKDSKDMCKIISYNVNGLRACIRSGLFERYVKREKPTILCLQETKVNEDTCPNLTFAIEMGYKAYFSHCRIKKGYSGTCILTKKKPISVKYRLGPKDKVGYDEGRVIVLEFDSFVLLNTYVPNSGRGLVRLGFRTNEWDINVQNFLRERPISNKPIIWTGDLNVAHRNIDYHDPKNSSLKNAGFTPQERMSFGQFLLEGEYFDAFRNVYPKTQSFTYFSAMTRARAYGAGWRLDYFIVHKDLQDRIKEVFQQPSVLGSDHSPVGMLIKY